MPVLTSVQPFTVNAALEADLDGTLAAIAARGFTAVEPYDIFEAIEASRVFLDERAAR